MQQAADFGAESEALARVTAGLDDSGFRQPTQFKGWTLNDVFVHLHLWNVMADLSVTDPAAFDARIGPLMAGIESDGFRTTENALVPQRGTALRDLWSRHAADMAVRWAGFDPKLRVKWAGPDMSVRSSITARQMETWAHGQEVYDHLGLERAETDRIRNIVVLGVNTYGWTYRVRGRDLPGPMPQLRLVAPSGAVWEYGEPQDESRIEGPALAFAQVVTQVRNVADTDLRVTGPVARDWMANAQCFAGAANPPPAPGTRFRRSV